VLEKGGSIGGSGVGVVGVTTNWIQDPQHQTLEISAPFSTRCRKETIRHHADPASTAETLRDPLRPYALQAVAGFGRDSRDRVE